MNTYICKCGRRVKKSTNADNTGNRLKGYGPGHECYGCPYAMPWGGNEWNETAKRFVQDIKGYECRMSRTLSYGSLFIGSTKDKCTCSVFSLDFDFLEHNGRYCCTFVCAANKRGISAKAALLARFFNPDGNRKGMTPQQEMEKVLADIRKATQAKEKLECTTMDSAAPSENAGTSFATGGAPLSNGTGSMTEPVHSAPQDKPLAFLPETTIPEFDYSGLPEPWKICTLPRMSTTTASRWPSVDWYIWAMPLPLRMMSSSHNATSTATSIVKILSVPGAFPSASPKIVPTGCCRFLP